MTSFLNKLRIPTLLGLGVLLIGISAGVYLVARQQIFFAKASPNLAAQNITLTNISDSQITISWQTQVETPAFIVYGQTSTDQTVLDDRDTNAPQPHILHHITVKNLLPKTTYQYKIVSGKLTSGVSNFTTASPASAQNGFSPVIGSVLKNNQSLEDGIAYLSIQGAATQSAPIKNSGNFVIPLSFVRKSDLSDTLPLESGTKAKITIISDKGESSVLLKLQLSAKPLPPLHMGQNLDLTTLDLESRISTKSSENLIKFDLNNDGLINASDYAIILKNFGKKQFDKNADLNKDGVVNQKDLELFFKEISP